MIKNASKAIKLFLMITGSLVLWSCESDPDNLGSQFFENNLAQGVDESYDLIAYNISNSDTLRADGRITGTVRKDTVVLGAFKENQFGGQKASFVSQVRLASFNPDFGTNPKIDSVVLSLRPKYLTGTGNEVTTTDENFVWGADNTPAKKVVKTYPVYKYGNASNTLTINVNEINDFLGSTNDIHYSNKSVTEGALLGSKTFNGKISSVEVTKKSDNSSLLSRPATIRMNLDANFFKTKIFDKKGSAELSNLSNFIRYFKGLKISIAETDGYLMKLQIPKDGDITIYYKKEVTANGTTKTENATFTLNLGSSNASFSKIEYDRTGSAAATALASANSTSGDAKLYVQGMGGPNFGVKIPDATINALKNKFTTDKVGILSAKFRFYTDASLWNNSFAKPQAFTVMQNKQDANGKTLYEFLKDLSAFEYQANYRLTQGYDLASHPSYYEINITQTLKDLVEKEGQTNQDFIIKLGQYLVNTSSGKKGLYGQNVDSRIYSPERVILVGTDAGNDKRAQLLITYIKK